MRVDDIICAVNDGKFSFGEFVRIVSNGRHFNITSRNIGFWAQRVVVLMHTTPDNIIDEVELA